MKNLLVYIICKIKRKTKKELGMRYAFHYFVCRNQFKAYYRTLAQ